MQNIDSDPQKAAIVSAVTALSKQLHIHVVAEGVETCDEQNTITGLGCDSVQGYLISQPLNRESMTNWLRGRVN